MGLFLLPYRLTKIIKSNIITLSPDLSTGVLTAPAANPPLAGDIFITYRLYANFCVFCFLRFFRDMVVFSFDLWYIIYGSIADRVRLRIISAWAYSLIRNVSFLLFRNRCKVENARIIFHQMEKIFYQNGWFLRQNVIYYH